VPGYLSTALATGADRIEAFFIVLGVAEPPTLDRIETWINDFQAEEIRLDVITPGALKLGLQRPCYAPLWREPLGIRVRATPFEALDDADLFSRNPERDHRPTLEELRATSAETSPAGVKVEGLLREHRCAIVRSHGATGKTVFASHLAVRHEDECGGAVYYLDLARPPDPGRADAVLDVVEEFGDATVLIPTSHGA
jgi:hypothetical protein